MRKLNEFENMLTKENRIKPLSEIRSKGNEYLPKISIISDRLAAVTKNHLYLIEFTERAFSEYLSEDDQNLSEQEKYKIIKEKICAIELANNVIKNFALDSLIDTYK